MTRRRASHHLKRLALLAFVLSGCSAALAAALETTPPTNPVSPDATSISAGKKLFSSNCTSCHGDAAQGDGKNAGQLNPKPANLVDETWARGVSDGQIFIVVRDGVKNTGMKAFGSSMTAHQIWDVVNYLRSIGPGIREPAH